MTIRENLKLSLLDSGTEEAEIEDKINESLEKLNCLNYYKVFLME